MFHYYDANTSEYIPWEEVDPEITKNSSNLTNDARAGEPMDSTSKIPVERRKKGMSVAVSNDHFTISEAELKAAMEKCPDIGSDSDYPDEEEDSEPKTPSEFSINFPNFEEQFDSEQNFLVEEESIPQAPKKKRGRTEPSKPIRKMVLEDPYEWAEKNYKENHIGTPSTQQDPGTFLVPCHIKDPAPLMALADLGASINTMPLTVFQRLNLPPVKPTDVAIRLLDNSVHYPIGIAEKVKVYIGRLTYEVDFMVMYTPEDPNVPLILGRPFLLIAEASICMRSRTLILRSNLKEEIFHITPSSIVQHSYANNIKMVSNKCGGGNRPEKGIVLEGADGGHVFEVD